MNQSIKPRILSYVCECCTSKPRIIAFSFDEGDFFQQRWANFLDSLRDKASLEIVNYKQAALTCLQQRPTPTVILLTDASLTKKDPAVWDAVIIYVRGGGIAIASAVNADEVHAESWEENEQREDTNSGPRPLGRRDKRGRGSVTRTLTVGL